MGNPISRIFGNIEAIVRAVAGVFYTPRCPIGWHPTALAPVFYGVRDYGPLDGAPGPCRVFFPTLDGAVYSARILRNCGTYPLLLFAHGDCSEFEHYKKWFDVPAMLARSGYVVVVPPFSEIGAGVHPSGADGDLALLGNMLDWMRARWEFRDTLRAPPQTGLLGHSFGALLAGRYAATTSAVTAFASLSGVWHYPTSPRPIDTLRIPTLLTWGSNQEPTFDIFTEYTEWSTLPRPKHRVVFDSIRHWDYLSQATSCTGDRGGCSLIPALSSELLMMFFSRYLPQQPDLTDRVSPTLVPPLFEELDLTLEQEFYAGSYLSGFSRIGSSNGCRVTLSWDVASGESGTETQPQ